MSSNWDFNDPPENSKDVEAELSRLMDELGGVGFAANQMGLMVRLFATKINGRTTFHYNPEIIQTSDEMILIEEGCLSFPELFIKVKRPRGITARYQDSLGNWVEEELTDLASRCYQHELDHLDGICFTNRVSKLTLDMARKKRTKRERNV